MTFEDGLPNSFPSHNYVPNLLMCTEETDGVIDICVCICSTHGMYPTAFDKCNSLRISTPPARQFEPVRTRNFLQAEVWDVPLQCPTTSKVAVCLHQPCAPTAAIKHEVSQHEEGRNQGHKTCCNLKSGMCLCWAVQPQRSSSVFAPALCNNSCYQA